MTGLTRRALAALPFAAAVPAVAQPPAAASPWPDATAMADAIRKGQLSPLDAVQSAIGRAEALQPRLNFMVNSDFDRAVEKARKGPGQGPFAGVPFLIKDLDDYRGLPTRSGMRATFGAPPAQTQPPLMDAYDAGGLIVFGKSASPKRASCRPPSRSLSARRTTLGISRGLRAALPAARPRRSRPASCPSLMPPMAGARSASRPRPAASSG